MGQTLGTATATANLANVQGVNQDEANEFLLYFAPSAGIDRLLEAIHALYYLPQNFKLVLAGDADVQSDKNLLWAMQNIMNRIRFGVETETSQQQASPFFDADAILTDDSHDPAFARVCTPLVVVKDDMDYDLAYNERHGFNVPAGNPEAFASAMLRLARERA
ncbi:MAG TPA: hypothetical protein VFT16_04985 [Candidatus Saccharimonadales bacterium]|nr:hypothetical protein [Candidatus Saccharimonadales bacterium]